MSEVTGLECKRGVYVRSSVQGDYSDAVVMKEVQHNSDGTESARMRVIENYEREFFITKPGYRDHKQKKSWEDEHKLQRFTSTQTNLARSIDRALGKYGSRGINAACDNPYVYGCDIPTPAIIKRAYMDKYPDSIGNNRVAVLDFETCVLKNYPKTKAGPGGPVICGSLTYGTEILLAYTKELANRTNEPSPTNKLIELLESELGDVLKVRTEKIRTPVPVATPSHRTATSRTVTVGNCTVTLVEVEEDIDVVCTLLKRTHELQPDTVTAWNLKFDFLKMIETFDKTGVDPLPYFNDPTVPEKYHQLDYVLDDPIRIKADGKKINKSNYELWNKYHVSASYSWICGMVTYRLQRAQVTGKAPSYALDYTLKDNGIGGKLKFEHLGNLEGLTSLEWHKRMQSKHVLEYMVYCIYDCIGAELLDESTGDLGSTLPILMGHSSEDYFPSTPKRLVDDLHFFLREKRNMLIATKGSTVVDELDSLVVGRDNWIITLQSYLGSEFLGQDILEDYPNQTTNVVTRVSDLDVAGSYPNTEDALNISKPTTLREVSKVAGLTEQEMRQCTLNGTAPITNAIELGVCYNKLPTMLELQAIYEATA